MGISRADNVRLDDCHGTVVAVGYLTVIILLFEFSNNNGSTVRDLLVRVMKDLLTDELCGNDALSLVSHVFAVIEPGAFRKHLGNDRQEKINIPSRLRADRNNVFKIVEFRIFLSKRQELFLACFIVFIDNKDNLLVAVFKKRQEFLLNSARFRESSVCEEHYAVSAQSSLVRTVDHELAHL